MANRRLTLGGNDQLDAFFKPADASTLIRIQTPQAPDRIWEVIHQGWQPANRENK